jgi:CRP/FNR family transcriptional regulator
MNGEALRAAAPIFQPLSAARLAHITAASRTSRHPKGAVLFRQDAPAQHVWLVRRGWVHLVRSHRGAHPVVLFTVTPREALCGLSAIEADTYSASGLAGSEVDVVRVPRGVFLDAVMHEAAFAYQALRLAADRMRQLAEQYGAIAEPVDLRIVRAILRLARQIGPDLPVTHRELSQMCWTSTESAIRAVRRLKQRGWLSGGRGRLTVIHPGRLAGVLGENGRAQAGRSRGASNGF